MSEGMTDLERVRVAAGFVLLACAAGWCLFHIALYYVARNLERKSK